MQSDRALYRAEHVAQHVHLAQKAVLQDLVLCNPEYVREVRDLFWAGKLASEAIEVLVEEGKVTPILCTTLDEYEAYKILRYAIQAEDAMAAGEDLFETGSPEDTDGKHAYRCLVKLRKDGFVRETALDMMREMGF